MKTLIIFALLVGNFSFVEAVSAKDAAKKTPAAHVSKMPETFDLKAIKVKPLEGADAKTVAQVFAEKATLKGKTVRIRAKVTKFLPSIMNMNWIHVSDGTGSVEGANFDLTVTSPAAEAKVGETVVIQGKVAVDQDLGAGYFFPVLIQEAKITPDATK